MACCLCFDFDALSLWLGLFRFTTANPLSRGEFGATVGVPRILELLDRYELKATFFVPGHTAVVFPDAVRAIHARADTRSPRTACTTRPTRSGSR